MTEHDVVLRDGTSASIRSIRPDDEARLMDFHGRLSSESQRLRFFSPHPHLQDSEVRRFVNVDGVSRVALVATRHDDIVGVARFDRVSGTTDAEVALVVEDSHQGNGLGTLLLAAVAQRAREQGVERFVAHVLPENARMREVFRNYRPNASTAFVDGVIDVMIPLAETGDVPRGLV